MSHSDIGLEKLSHFFHLPISEVAKELGICATVLKKICRRSGIPRWPHRKLKSIEKSIASLEEATPKSYDDEVRIFQEIQSLKDLKERLIKDPSILVQDRSTSEMEVEVAKKKKRKVNEENKFSRPKGKKLKLDDPYDTEEDEEDEELYSAERVLAQFCMYSRELAKKSDSKKSSSSFVVPSPIYQQPFLLPSNSYYYSGGQMPVYTTFPFSSISHSTTGPFKGSKRSSPQKCNLDNQSTPYPILPNPYLYSYNFKHQLTNFDPGTLMFLINNQEVESAAHATNM